MLESIIIALLSGLLFLTFRSNQRWRRKASAPSARERQLEKLLEESYKARREALALENDPTALQAKLKDLKTRLAARRAQAIEEIKVNFKFSTSISRFKLSSMIEECCGAFALNLDYNFIENGMDSQDIIEFTMDLEETANIEISDEVSQSIASLKIGDLLDVFGEIGFIYE